MKVCIVGKHRIKAGTTAFRVNRVGRSDTLVGRVCWWLCSEHFHVVEDTLRAAL